MSDGNVIDTRGIPSRVCVCGGDTFKVLARFDEDNEIAWHTLNGYCHACGAAVTLPEPGFTPAGQMEFDLE